MTRKELTMKIEETLNAQGIECCSAGSKGNGFFIKGHGFVKYEAARKMAGLPKHDVKISRQPRMTAYGDYAIVAALSGKFNG